MICVWSYSSFVEKLYIDVKGNRLQNLWHYTTSCGRRFTDSVVWMSSFLFLLFRGSHIIHFVLKKEMRKVKRWAAQILISFFILYLTAFWIQSFFERFEIASGAHTGMYSFSPTKQNKIEMSVTAHLGYVSDSFCRKLIKAKNVENDDETHFMIIADNKHTLRFSVDKGVKYSDVVSGREGFTMDLRLTFCHDAIILPPFMVFQNVECNYTIQNVPSTVPEASNHTEKRDWMDRTVMSQCLSEGRLIILIPNHRCILYPDICRGRACTPKRRAALAKIRTEIRFFHETQCI